MTPPVCFPPLLAAIDGDAVPVIVGLAIAVLVLGIYAVTVPRRLTRTLQAMRDAAQRLAAGELSERMPESQLHRQAHSLAEAINEMAVQLQQQLEDMRTTEQRLNAVLESMVEGMLVVDKDDRLLMLNGAAADLLSVEQEKATGRSIFEVIRHAGIQRFVVRSLNHLDDDPLVEDVVLHDGGARYFQAVGTPLRNRSAVTLGAVVVLHDVTRLHRLEAAQRDFVANVSHELRTPVTSIQGFAETLLDSDADDVETGRRFLSIIIENAERLESLIDDLLRLSRVEGEAESGTLALKRVRLEPFVANIVERMVDRVDTHSLWFESPDEDSSAGPALGPGSVRPIYAWLDEGLFEQAITNLLDNAVKYSEPGSSVYVRIVPHEREVEVQVADEGVGISRDNRSRIFDRFYRVDKSRSRRIGGTGLGLPIVKHIVRAHAGRIEVESELGEGSTFRIFLPNQVRLPSTRISQALYSVHARIHDEANSSSGSSGSARTSPVPPQGGPLASARLRLTLGDREGERDRPRRGYA